MGVLFETHHFSYPSYAPDGIASPKNVLSAAKRARGVVIKHQGQSFATQFEEKLSRRTPKPKRKPKRKSTAVKKPDRLSSSASKPTKTKKDDKKEPDQTNYDWIWIVLVILAVVGLLISILIWVMRNRSKVDPPPRVHRQMRHGRHQARV